MGIGDGRMNYYLVQWRATGSDILYDRIFTCHSEEQAVRIVMAAYNYLMDDLTVILLDSDERQTV